jgi:hypothetical protein
MGLGCPRRIDAGREEEAMDALNERHFQLRLSCHYEDPDNSIVDLKVEVLAQGQWEALDLGPHTPGFLLLVYTILTCQHRYLRVNCAEKGLRLASANGSIDLLASDDWFIQKLHIRFDARLKSGIPTRGDMDDIVDRMLHCPVSKNLKEVPDCRTEVHLD